MAIKLLAVNDIKNIRIAEYIVDTENEKNNILVEDKVFGTKCYVVENGKSYRLNSNLEWVEENKIENNSINGNENNNSSSNNIIKVKEKDINFIDYDGTILYSYTKSEFSNLSVLPDNPSHEGLTAQGWNWTKQQITTQLTAAPDQKVWVGQMYKTTSGKTEIDIELDNAGLLTPYLKITVNGTVEVDWGDGSEKSTITGASLTTLVYTSHTYVATGNYTISIEVKSGSFTFYNTYILSHTNSTSNTSRRYNSSIVAVRLGDGITSIGNNAFQYCPSLQNVTIPSEVTSIGTNTFTYCSSLQSVTIPSGVTSIGNSIISSCSSLQSIAIPSGVTSIGASAFQNCYSLQSIIIPNGVTSIEAYAFYACHSLQSITIPGNVTLIGSSAFSDCLSLYRITFKPISPPTVSNSNTWLNISTDCKIYVPSGRRTTYISTTNYLDSNTYTYIEE